MKGPPPLRIALCRSRLAAACVVVACLASATLVALLPFEPLYRGLALAAIGAQAIWTLRTWAMRSALNSIVSIELTGDGRAALIERCGRRYEGRVRPASYVGTSLITLVVRGDAARFSRAIAILPDMATDEERRRLRLLLRCAGSLQSS
jgi:hypothetical protein